MSPDTTLLNCEVAAADGDHTVPRRSVIPVGLSRLAYVFIPGTDEGRSQLLAALRRLWLLPFAVTTAFLLSLPFGSGNGYSDNALIVLEIPLAAITFTIVFTAILTPGAAAHTLLVAALEAKAVPAPVRAAIALVTSPLIGGWLVLFEGDDDLAAWLAYFGSMVLFACASIWYGSRQLTMRVTRARRSK